MTEDPFAGLDSISDISNSVSENDKDPFAGVDDLQLEPQSFQPQEFTPTLKQDQIPPTEPIQIPEDQLAAIDAFEEPVQAPRITPEQAVQENIANQTDKASIDRIKGEQSEDNGFFSVIGHALKSGYAGFGKTVGTTAKIIGADEWGDYAFKYWDSVAQKNNIEDFRQSVWDKPRLMTDPKWWAYKGAEMIPGMIEMVGLAGAAGAVAGTGAALSTGAATKLAPALKIGTKLTEATPQAIVRASKIGSAIGAFFSGGTQTGATIYEEMKNLGAADKDAAKGYALGTLAGGLMNMVQINKAIENIATKSPQKALILDALMNGAVTAANVPVDYGIRNMLDAIGQDETLLSSVKQGIAEAPFGMIAGTLMSGLPAVRAAREKKAIETAQAQAKAEEKANISATLSKATDETLAAYDIIHNPEEHAAILKKDDAAVKARFGENAVKIVESDDPIWEGQDDLKTQHRLVKSYADALGENVMFFSSEGPDVGNGFRTDNAIYVNVNKPQTWLMQTFLHEHMHNIIEVNKKNARKQGIDAKDTETGRLLGETEKFVSKDSPEKYQKALEELGKIYPKKDVPDEYLAKVFETFAGDTEFHRDLLEKNPTLFKKLWSVITEFFDKFSHFVSHGTMEAPVGEGGKYTEEQIKAGADRGAFSEKFLKQMFGGDLGKVRDNMLKATKLHLEQRQAEIKAKNEAIKAKAKKAGMKNEKPKEEPQTATDKLAETILKGAPPKMTPAQMKAYSERAREKAEINPDAIKESRRQWVGKEEELLEQVQQKQKELGLNEVSSNLLKGRSGPHILSILHDVLNGREPNFTTVGGEDQKARILKGMAKMRWIPEDISSIPKETVETPVEQPVQAKQPAQAWNKRTDLPPRGLTETEQLMVDRMAGSTTKFTYQRKDATGNAKGGAPAAVELHGFREGKDKITGTLVSIKGYVPNLEGKKVGDKVEIDKKYLRLGSPKKLSTLPPEMDDWALNVGQEMINNRSELWSYRQEKAKRRFSDKELQFATMKLQERVKAILNETEFKHEFTPKEVEEFIKANQGRDYFRGGKGEQIALPPNLTPEDKAKYLAVARRINESVDGILNSAYADFMKATQPEEGPDGKLRELKLVRDQPLTRQELVEKERLNISEIQKKTEREEKVFARYDEEQAKKKMEEDIKATADKATTEKKVAKPVSKPVAKETTILENINYKLEVLRKENPLEVAIIDKYLRDKNGAPDLSRVDPIIDKLYYAYKDILVKDDDGNVIPYDELTPFDQQDILSEVTRRIDSVLKKTIDSEIKESKKTIQDEMEDEIAANIHKQGYKANPNLKTRFESLAGEDMHKLGAQWAIGKDSFDGIGDKEALDAFHKISKLSKGNMDAKAQFAGFDLAHALRYHGRDQQATTLEAKIFLAKQYQGQSLQAGAKKLSLLDYMQFELERELKHYDKAKAIAKRIRSSASIKENNAEAHGIFDNEVMNALANANPELAEAPAGKDGISPLAKEVKRVMDQMYADIKFDPRTSTEYMDVFKKAEATRWISSTFAKKPSKVLEYWKSAGLLSGLQTLIQNPISNIIRGAYEFGPKGILKSFIERSLGQKGAVGAHASALNKVLGTGMSEVMNDAWHRALQAYNTEIPTVMRGAYGGVNDIGVRENNRANFAIGGKLGRVIRLPFRLLTLADEFNKHVILSAAMQAQAYKNLMKDKPITHVPDSESVRVEADKIRESTAGSDPARFLQLELARLQALEGTWQNSPGKLSEAIIELRGKYPALHYVAPFLVTPMNMLIQGMRMSPLGSIALAKKLAFKEYGTKAEFASDARMQSKFAGDVAEQVLAWGTAAFISSLLDPDEKKRKGILGIEKMTGNRDPSQSAVGKNAMNLRENEDPPLSVKINGKWISYKRMEPLASILPPIIDAINEFHKIGKENKDTTAAMAKVLKLTSKAALDKGFMSSVADLNTAMSLDERDTQRWVSNFAASWVPSIYRSTARSLEPMQKETKSFTEPFTKEWLGETANRSLREAGLQNIVPRVDYWGSEITKSGLKPNTDLGYRLAKLAGFDIQVPKEYKITAMIQRWNNVNRYKDAKNKDAEYYITVPAKVIEDYKGKRIELNEKQYQDYAKYIGLFAKEYANAQSWDFENPTFRDIERLRNIRSRAVQRARREMLNRMGK